MVSLFLAVVVLTGPPPIPECKGALEPSVKNGCAGVSSTGCCDTFGRNLW